MEKKLTLNKIIDTAPSLELKIMNKKFSDETIQPREGKDDLYLFSCGFLNDSTFINIQFIKVYFELGALNHCRFENCTFTAAVFKNIHIDQCVFTNCQFINELPKEITNNSD